MVPQVLLTLNAEGSIVAEVPVTTGTPRKQVEITDLQQIRRLLSAQLAKPSPTLSRRIDPGAQSGQVRHWHEHHARNHRDSECPWCMADELGIDTTYAGYRKAKRALNLARNVHKVGDGTVKVRIIPAKSSRLSKTDLNASISMNLDDM